MNAEPVVLVAEDEADMLDLISRRVQRLGFQVIKVHDGKEAMDALLRSPVDLVVTDINMPGYSGLEILSEAKQRDPNMQVIIVTANATMENAIEALNRGAFSYLTKPFDHISVISNAVSRAIEFRRLTLDNIRMAKAQKRRGDMLEDEVTDRLRQFRRQEETYREMLAQLPQGIILASVNGRHMAKNPAGESWLAEDARSEDRPIERFLEGLVNLDGEPAEEMVDLAGKRLRLRANPLGDGPETVERLVLVEEVQAAAGSVPIGDISPMVVRLSEDLSRIRSGHFYFKGKDLLREMDDLVRRLEVVCQMARASGPGSLDFLRF